MYLSLRRLECRNIMQTATLSFPSNRLLIPGFFLKFVTKLRMFKTMVIALLSVLLKC